MNQASSDTSMLRHEFATHRFLGQSFVSADDDKLLAFIRTRADSPQFSYIVTPNTDHIVKIDRLSRSELGPALEAAYESADIRLCDSRILALLARLSGIDLRVVTGSDLTRRLFEDDIVLPGDNVGLIGGTARQLAWLRAYRPEVQFHGYVPPPGVLHNRLAQTEIAEFVEQTPCNFYFFAFGAPQSELVAAQIKRGMQARGVALCIGASIEFLSGAKPRAPIWVQRLCLEWLYRLIREPRRLARRYLIEGPRILLLWQREHAAIRRTGNRR